MLTSVLFSHPHDPETIISLTVPRSENAAVEALRAGAIAEIDDTVAEAVPPLAPANQRATDDCSRLDTSLCERIVELQGTRETAKAAGDFASFRDADTQIIALARELATVRELMTELQDDLRYRRADARQQHLDQQRAVRKQLRGDLAKKQTALFQELEKAAGPTIREIVANAYALQELCERIQNDAISASLEEGRAEHPRPTVTPPDIDLALEQLREKHRRALGQCARCHGSICERVLPGGIRNEVTGEVYSGPKFVCANCGLEAPNQDELLELASAS